VTERAAERGPASVAPAGGPARVRRVLVVEDDPGLCDAVGRVARGLGAEVSQAQSLDRALRLLGEGPDLVIVDLRLDGRSAFPLIEAAVARMPRPAVVAMSGQASAEESFRLGELGVHAYLPKPFASEQLLAAIERALAAQEGGAAGDADAGPPNGGAAGASPARFGALRAALARAIAWARRGGEG
jgi:DNA-binding response OmpR family regulator